MSYRANNSEYQGNILFGVRFAQAMKGAHNTSRQVPHQVMGVVEKKNCSLCASWKPLDQFNVQKARYDGLHPSCRDCNHERRRELATAAERKEKAR